MVVLSFSFPNSERKIQCTFDSSMRISEVKKYMLEHEWPSEQVSPAYIQKLRLISMGKELQDTSTIGSIKVASADTPIPILIHITQRETSSDTHSTSNCCSCILL